MSNTISIAYSSPYARLWKGGRLDRSLPSAWHELEPRQVWACVDMLMNSAPRKEILRYLLEIPNVVFNRLDTGEIYDLLQCISWMDVDPKSPAPLAPYIDHRSKGGKITRLYLPSARFQNVTGREYAMIDDTYAKFIPDYNTDHQSQMIAICVRPEGPEGKEAADPRVPLRSRAQIHEWLPIIRALPESVRTYLTLLISANRQFIHDTWKDWLFTDGGAEEGGTDGLDFGWWGAFMNVAEQRTFGNYDQVLDTAIQTICMYMASKVEAARKLKQDIDHANARASMGR